MEYSKKSNILSIVTYFVLMIFFLLSLKLLWPLYGGLLLAYIFNHIAVRLYKKNKIVTLIVALLFYVTVILIFWGLFAVLFNQIIKLSHELPDFYENILLPAGDVVFVKLITFLNNAAPSLAISVTQLFDAVAVVTNEFVKNSSSAIISNISGMLSNFPLFAIGFIFMIVSSFYISFDYENVVAFLIRQLPKRIKPIFFDTKDFIISSFFKLFKAYFIIVIITFVELSFGLWLLKINSFIKIAGIIALLDILPFVGSGAILIPWGIYKLVTEDITFGFALILLYLVISVVRNIVEPKIVGDNLGLHPVVALACIFAGLKLFGVVGIVLVPISVLLIKYLNQKRHILFYK